MSDRAEIGHLSGAASLSFSASATISASHAHTGRATTADQDHALAGDWSRCTSRTELITHGGFSRFRAAFAKPTLIESNLLVCFRGRPFSLDAVPHSPDMGPPPVDKAIAGRYNRRGSPALYLSDSVEGVLRECTDDGRALWVQEFLLPASELKIVDTSASIDGEFLNQVFWFTELEENVDRGGEPTFSQFVAELVAERFDGMLVRGVRGDPSAHYKNVVMFRPAQVWTQWFPSTHTPTRIR